MATKQSMIIRDMEHDKHDVAKALVPMNEIQFTAEGMLLTDMICR